VKTSCHLSLNYLKRMRRLWPSIFCLSNDLGLDVVLVSNAKIDDVLTHA